MTTQNGRAFNEWLRAQLKAKKMSQRQLAQQSGVDHSTISRLIRGDRMPSLGTATKLARGLRELRDDADTTQYLGLVAAGKHESHGARRIRAPRRRTPERAAGSPDHGVLPRRTDAPLRPNLPAARGQQRVRSDSPSAPPGGRPPRPVRSAVGGRDHRHGAPGLPLIEPGTGALLSTHQGTTRIRPPRSGSRGSERRRLGRRRSRFLGVRSRPAVRRPPAVAVPLRRCA